MFDGNFRKGVDRRTRPIGELLVRIGVTADQLTLSGLVFSVVSGVVLVFGHLLIGLIFLILGALPDTLDGPVAKASQATSRRGAFFDSVADRGSDLAIFGGLAWYFVRTGSADLAVGAFGVYGLASLISYQRAKAESLGFNAKGGVFERAERLVALGVGLAFPLILPEVIVLLLAGGLVTVVQRFVKVWKQASAQPDRLAAASRVASLRRAGRRRREKSALNRYLSRRMDGSSRRRPRRLGGS